MRCWVIGIVGMLMVGCSGVESGYWIQKESGKTHNAGCRYYGKCKGYRSAVPSGNDCRFCGGAAGRSL